MVLLRHLVFVRLFFGSSFLAMAAPYRYDLNHGGNARRLLRHKRPGIFKKPLLRRTPDGHGTNVLRGHPWHLCTSAASGPLLQLTSSNRLL